MQHTDSSSGILLLQYGADDSEDEASFAETLLENVESYQGSHEKESRSLLPHASSDDVQYGISDEDLDQHSSNLRKRLRHEDDFLEEPVPVKISSIRMNIAPSVSPPVEVISPTNTPDSQQSMSRKKPYKPTLVSYVGHEEDEEDSDSSDDEDDDDDGTSDSNAAKSASSPVPSVLINMDSENIQIPLEPPTRCSNELQEKITKLYTTMKNSGFDANADFQRLTSFRNPSIYEKLIHTYGIDERGSNLSLDVFNPHMWGKESFYDELDKAQKKDMERREKERKAKIEFVSGTKKPTPTTAALTTGAPSDSNMCAEDKKRKSKWDAHAKDHLCGLNAANNGNGATTSNLTTTATGTRTTVISAVGMLAKKSVICASNYGTT